MASDWFLGGTAHGYGQAVAVAARQVAGALGGAALADARFAVPVLTASRHHRSGLPVLLGEGCPSVGVWFLVRGL